jgi:hypothetical protein
MKEERYKVTEWKGKGYNRALMREMVRSRCKRKRWQGPMYICMYMGAISTGSQERDPAVQHVGGMKSRAAAPDQRWRTCMQRHLRLQQGRRRAAALDSHHPTLHHRTAPAVGVPPSWRWPGMALQVPASTCRWCARACATVCDGECVYLRLCVCAPAAQEIVQGELET